MYPHGLYIQLVDRLTGDVVTFPGGSKAEADLVALIRDAVVARGVGVFRTSAHVAADVEDAVRSVFYDFKMRTVLG